MEINGKVAIVTGGATGIGRAVCLHLAGAGASAVVINYSRSAEDAQATTAKLQSLGVNALPYKADVANEREVKAMTSAAVGLFGRLDILVNSAGMTHFIPHRDLDALTDEVWKQVLDVNLMGTFYACRAVASELRKVNGAIVNIASMSGHRATGSSIAYMVSKAGVLQLTRALALALAPNVRVNSVSPGHVSTRWSRQRLDKDTAEAQERASAAATPLGMIARPDDVAQLVIALLENDSITGQDLVIDGGRNVRYAP
jgi:3-oxoacyl-[acyl-carrier protein] reductase